MESMFSTIDQSSAWESPDLSPLSSHTMVHNYNTCSPAYSPEESHGWFPLSQDMPPLHLPKGRADPYPSPLMMEGHHRSLSMGGWEEAMTPHPHHSRSMSMEWEQENTTPLYPMYATESPWQDPPSTQRMPPPHPINLSHPRRTTSRSNVSIGRWTEEEHSIFLKGLQLYQGPAWTEISRMIGTRTSIQVRTHAQKFFTKLARMNQTFPYFETQIQKERIRLVAQGELLSNTTPISMSVPNFSRYPSLSPPQKRGLSEMNSLGHKQDESNYGGPSTTYNQRIAYPDMNILSNPYNYIPNEIQRSRKMDTNSNMDYSPRILPTSYSEEYLTPMNSTWEATTESERNVDYPQSHMPISSDPDSLPSVHMKKNRTY